MGTWLGARLLNLLLLGYGGPNIGTWVWGCVLYASLLAMYYGNMFRMCVQQLFLVVHTETTQ